MIPRFKGVGTRLLQAAVLRSREEGFEGRLGLHTLPQSQTFYVEVCGMQALGLDADYQGLAYLEFAPDNTSAFVDSEGERR